MNCKLVDVNLKQPQLRRITIKKKFKALLNFLKRSLGLYLDKYLLMLKKKSNEKWYKRKTKTKDLSNIYGASNETNWITRLSQMGHVTEFILWLS